MTVQRLTGVSAAGISTMAAVLAEAFANYAWTDWTVDSDRREARIAAIQRLYLEHVALPHGEIWADGELRSVAVLIPRENIELAPEVQEKLVSLHGVSGERLQFPLPQKPEGTWTLAAIGVVPSAQGNGLGTALLAEIARDADVQGRRIGLETSTESNVELYRRFGFVVWAVSELPDGGPIVFSMLREPIPSTHAAAVAKLN